MPEINMLMKNLVEKCGFPYWWPCWSFQQGSTGSRSLDMEKWLLIRSVFFVESGLKNLCLEEFDSILSPSFILVRLFQRTFL